MFLLGMHIILEFIPNHTSNTSNWFTASVNYPKSKYGDYYIWRGSDRMDADGKELPPNDWVRLNGSWFLTLCSWDQKCSQNILGRDSPSSTITVFSTSRAYDWKSASQRLR